MVFPKLGKNWQYVLFVLFAFSGLLVPPTNFAFAHYDPKGLPPVRVDVELISLKVNDDWDDGIDRDAEIVMGTLLAHGEDASHGKKHDVITWGDWDTDESYKRSQRIDKTIHTHIQCNPKSPVALAFKVVESDQFNPEQTALSIGTAFTAFLTLPPPVNIGVSVLGAVISTIPLINEDDLIGTGVTIIPSSGYKFIDLADDSGKKTGQVYVSVQRTILNEGHEAYEYCKTNAEPDPVDKHSIAPFLEEAKKSILSFKGPMGGEKGTEGSKQAEKDARNAAFKLLLDDMEEVYDHAGNLIDENYVDDTVDQLIDLAIQYEKDGQLDDAAETYLKALEKLEGDISDPDSALSVIARDNMVMVTGKGGQVIIDDEKSCSATAYFHYVLQEVKNKNVNHLKVQAKVTAPKGETFTTEAKYVDGRFQGKFPAVTFGTYTIEILSTEPWKLEKKDTHPIRVVFSPCPGVDTLSMKLDDEEPKQPEIYYLKPADPIRIISEIEELTRETSELLDKQMEKREKEKKEQKSKSKQEDKQVLTGLFTATKWLEYANKMISDALKQDKSQESKDGLKQATNQAKEIKQLNTDIKKEAKESKVSQADLNKAAKEPIDKLKSKKPTKSEDKIKDAQKAIEKTSLPLSISAKSLGDILENIRLEDEKLEEELKRLPGLADTLTVKSKDGYFEGEICDGTAIVTAEWELVTPRGAHPQESFSIEIDIYDDGKKVSTRSYILADNTFTKLYDQKGNSKIAPDDKSDHPDFFYTRYQANFDPKKGKTIEFKLSDKQRLLEDKYALIESQFPITVKIPNCKIDSVIDDLPVHPLTDQDLPIHDKKSDITSKPKDDSKSDTTKKPIKKTDKPKDAKKKDTTTKPKTSAVEYDSQTITGLFGAIKWAQYSQTLLLDAVNQHNKGLKTQIKEDEAEYAETKNRELMDAVVEYKDTVKENEKAAKDLVKIGDQLKKAESDIRKEAAKKKILPADLNKGAQEPINKIELIPPEELDKLKEAEKAQKRAEEMIKLFKTSAVITGPIPILKLSVKDLEWSYDGNVCDGQVTIMLDWETVDQNGKPYDEISTMFVRVFEGTEYVGLANVVPGKNGFESDYKVSFDPKKGKTLTFKLFESSYSDTPFGSITAKIPPCLIDSVIDDLQPIVVIDQDGAPRKDTPRLVSDVIKINDNLKKITTDLKDNIGKPSKTQDKPSQQTMPQTPPPQSPSTQPPSSLTPTIKTVKLVDKNRSAIQHSADPCLTTHTIWYQFAFTTGGYPAGDKITVTENGPRGNLVHKGTLDSQGKYQIIIQNPPMQPGFEFRLTEYQSSGNKLETALPDIWQFNVGPCVMPGTPGIPQPPSQPPAEQQTGGSGQLYFVQAYSINGKDYPIYQFVSSPPDSCNDYHFHTSSGKAYAIDGTLLNDPAPSGCGFGKTNSMGFTSAGVYKNQITAWESLTGINIPEDD